MKHIVQVRKAAIGLLILLLITILTLTIPTKGHAQVNLNFADREWYVGMERLTLTAEELRAAAVANGGNMVGGAVSGGYAVISLRHYLVLPPGTLDDLDALGKQLYFHTGSNFAYLFDDPADTLGVVFAGNNEIRDPRQNNITQPRVTDVYASFYGSNSTKVEAFHTPGESTPMYVMSTTAQGTLFTGGLLNGVSYKYPWIYGMSEMIMGATDMASSDNTVNNHGVGELYDTVFLRRIAFVVHDVEAFIAQEGFDVRGNNDGYREYSADACQHQTLLLAVSSALGGTANQILCERAGYNDSYDWAWRLGCGSNAVYTAGGVVVISTPQIHIPKTWRPCPTHTIC
jgi:hypothetical protein